MTRALAAVALFAALSCHAAEWVLEPSIDSKASTTDNLNLTPGFRESSWWMTLSPALAFSRNTEISQVLGSVRLNVNRYPDDRQLDTEDQLLYFSSKLNDERNQFGLSGTYTRDSTLQTELQTTGIPQVRRQRTQTGIQPSWQHSLDERNAVFANYNYEKADYEAGAGLVDYSNQQVSVGLQHLWNERTTVALIGVYSRYETDTGSQTTQSGIVNANVVYKPSERTDLSFQAGWRNSTIEIHNSFDVCPAGDPAICQFLGIPLVRLNQETKSTDDGWLLDVSAAYRWESATASLSIGRDINPTGGGLLVQTDNITAGYSRQFSERLSGTLGASFLQSQYLGGVGAGKSDYYRLDGGLTWTLSEYWRLNAGYSYAHQRSENTPEAATANSVFVSLGYNWPRISLSR
jgi:hypothetical protein